jgi:hypothetical protein
VTGHSNFLVPGHVILFLVRLMAHRF